MLTFLKTKSLQNNSFLFILLVALSYINSSMACDVCGCGAGGQYFGILPQFQRHFVGVRFQYQRFASTHPALLSFEKPATARDEFWRTEVWGRYVLHPRLHLYAVLPYQKAQQIENESEKSAAGWGDLTIQANFILLNTGDSISAQWRHAVAFGTGIKAPTGKYTFSAENQQLPMGIQPGSGSWDVPFSFGYTVRKGKLGVNNEVNYRYNTRNVDGFRFGDRLTVSSRAFAWFKIQRFTLLPSLGIQYYSAERNQQDAVNQDYSGGSSTSLFAGGDVYWKSLHFAAGWLPVLSQHLGDGQTKNRQQIQFSLNFLL